MKINSQKKKYNWNLPIIWTFTHSVLNAYKIQKNCSGFGGVARTNNPLLSSINGQIFKFRRTQNRNKNNWIWNFLVICMHTYTLCLKYLQSFRKSVQSKHYTPRNWLHGGIITDRPVCMIYWYLLLVPIIIY